MNHKFKVGDWVVRKPHEVSSWWKRAFPGSFDLPHLVTWVGENGAMHVDGQEGCLDRCFTLSSEPAPINLEDYL